MKRDSADAITLSTVWHTFQSTCREMRHVLDRTAQNYLMAQLHDVAAGIWDGQARTLAVPAGPTSQLLGQKFSVRYILDKFGANLYPGDVILNNDPYHGYCNHLPDWGFFRPIFYKDELLFFTLARGHQMDTGGSYPGAYFPDGYDIHSEGLCIPPIKVFEKGVERKDVFELVWNNVRWPEAVRVDNYALIAATKVCENRLLALVKRYGKDTVLDCVEEMLNRTERAVRAEIARVPDGAYYGEAASDDDGTEHDVPLWVRCEVRVHGEEMTIDFSKSEKQRKGFVNNTLPSTYSRAIAGSFLFFDPALADFHNEGSMKPVHIVAPEGSVVNAKYPATVGGSPVSVGTQILEATVVALSQAMPHKAIASWGRHRGHYIFGADPRTRERYVQTTFDSDGGAGAVWGYDGYEGACTFPTLGSVQRGNVEEVEIRFPWRIVRYHMVPDLSGAGKWRGGSGMRWEALNVGSEGGMATGSSDGDQTRPPAAAGGMPGPLCKAYLERDGKRIVVKSHRMYQIHSGDLLVKISGGGSGVGPPEEREPDKVLNDVLDGFISLNVAEKIYRVAIDPNAMTINWQRTRALRDASLEESVK
jgi:N-methylhydantoinase B